MPTGKSENGCGEALMRLSAVASVALIALRADGVIAWPWWCLLAPPACAFALVLLSVVVVALGENR